MSNNDIIRFKKFLYYICEAISIGIDIVHPIWYSFFIASTVIGFDLLYLNKKPSDIPKLQYILGLIIIPIIVGWMLQGAEII